MATPVLLSHTVHLGVCDRTLCGRWIWGDGTFGDFVVTCGSCLRIQSARNKAAA